MRRKHTPPPPPHRQARTTARRGVGGALAASAVVLLAGRAAALAPIDAATAAARLGRPLPTLVHVEPSARAAHGAATRMFAPGGGPLPVYLNRFGGTYRCGNDDSALNISSVVCDANARTVGGFSGTEAQWTFVRDCVAELFAPFNMYVTDLEPTSGAYVEAVVGGSPDEAGLPFGVGGVAPFSCGLIDNAVVYAFADVYGSDMQGVCETVAQEVAHAFGLDHEFLCADPMTYLGGCGAKTFQDTWAQCGEFEPRECYCGGTSQNSVQAMLETLGAADGSAPPPPPVDTAVPTVSLVSPLDGAILPADSTITVEAEASDDVGLTTVELEWDFTSDVMYCPASFEQTGSYACARSGTRATWQIRVGAGSRTFRVQVRDVAGNTATSDTRSIWLSSDGSGPPDDSGPPTVFVASPTTGAVLPGNATLDVVATITDDSDIARAELLWTNNGSESSFPCPVSSENVSCQVDGTTHTWSLRVGEGPRSFFLRATDVVGGVTETEPRSITLREGTPPVDDADDDTIDRAAPVGCGEARDAVASDADWYDVDAPAGKLVVVRIDGEALGDVGLVATTGPGAQEVVATGRGGLEFTSAGEAVAVAVVPDRADAGGYTLTLTCEDPPPPSDGVDGGGLSAAGDGRPDADARLGCASGAGAGWWGASLLLLRRRRRPGTRSCGGVRSCEIGG